MSANKSTKREDSTHVKDFVFKHHSKKLTPEEKVRAIKIVELNKEIAKCADRKDLTNALQLYESATDKNVHTHAAVLNACVRCGEMKQAVEIFNKMKLEPKFKLDIVCCTTLMKGYCAEGDLPNSLALLKDMVEQRPHPVYPNIRTINTYLRGCVLIGDCASAMDMYQSLQSVYKVQTPPDASTWEYIITLLTQSLDLDRCLPIIGRLISRNTEGISYAAFYLAVARASAILHQFKACNKYINLTRVALEDEDNKHISVDSMVEALEPESAIASGSKQKVVGGKRAWKTMSGNDDSATGMSESRTKSLEVYVQHRRSEMMQELAVIEQYCKKQLDIQSRTKKNPTAALYKLVNYYKKMILFPHNTMPMVGSSTETDAETATPENKLIPASLYDRLGMKIVAKQLNAIPTSDSDAYPLARYTKKEDGTEESNKVDVIADFDAYLDSAVNNEQKKVDFSHVFDSCEDDSSDPKGKPLKLEICSGAGEWAVAQAKNDPNANWVALELRFDRAYQTFARAYFEGVNNLSIMRGDANMVVRKHVKPKSISHIFINHPEPPQQRGGMNYESTGKHLLTRRFFVDMQKLLVEQSDEYSNGGLITIVTDNVWYGKFLIKLLSTHSHDIPLVSRQEDESFSVCERIDDFVLYSGKPGASGGHVVDASSYFDRLWNREKIVERYFIILQTGRSTKSNSTTMGLMKTVAAHTSGKTVENGRVKSGKVELKPLMAVHLPAGGTKSKKVSSVEKAESNDVTTGAAYLSSNNPKYSIKSSGSILTGVNQNKKMTFDDDDDDA